MDQNQFGNALEKGFGRAYLYVEQYGDESIREQLLHACLINQSYDVQCEDSRAEWLMSLINISKNRDFYIQKIIAALAVSTEHSDVSQLYELCKIFAQDGNESAKLAIYTKFNLQEFRESYLGGDQIIQMDGLEGLLHITKVIGKRIIEEDDYWEGDQLYCKTCKMFGKEPTDDFLTSHSKENHLVTSYLGELKKHEERCKPQDSRTHIKRLRDENSIERIIEDVDNSKGKYPGKYMSFGRYATIDEIERIFSLLLTETNKDRLIRYLWIFRRRELPRLPQSIAELALSPDHEIQDAAISALANLSEPIIREIAITLCANEDKEIALNAIELFINNYLEGDSKYIEPLLNTVWDKDILQGACMDVIKLFENHPFIELINIMLWAYENTPCTHCRNWAVRLLIERAWLPEVQLNECMYDCVEDTRKLAKVALNS